MKNVEALFVDCDGVLYDKNECTDRDIAVVGLGKTLEQYHITWDEFDQKRAELKKRGVRGVFNSALALCKERHIAFNAFACNMVSNIDYSRISQDLDMLNLLRQAGSLLPIYIVTNNTVPHLNKIFGCLQQRAVTTDMEKKLNVKFVAIEHTLEKDGVFHSKKMNAQFQKLCQLYRLNPENVLLLDDAQSVCDEAINQGLQVQMIRQPGDTKQVLRRIIHEKQQCKRRASIRKTRGGIGD